MRAGNSKSKGTTMKALFHVMIAVLILADVVALAGCAGQTSTPGEVTEVATAEKSYSLDEIGQAADDMHHGVTVKPVIVF